MEKTLDFKVIFYLLRKKAVWLVLAAIVGALISFVYAKTFIPEKFSSSAQIYISNVQEAKESAINYADLTASKSLASTYCIILQSDRAHALLNEELKSNEYYQKMVAESKNTYTISVNVKDESEVLTLSVSSLDPEYSRIVCDTMIEVSKTLIEEIFDGGRSNPLGQAKANSTPASPNVERIVAVGALLAFVILSVIVVLWELLDNRVKDEADFVAKVNIPVLGEVPSIHEEIENTEGYYYAYTKKQDD